MSGVVEFKSTPEHRHALEQLALYAAMSDHGGPKRRARRRRGMLLGGGLAGVALGMVPVLLFWPGPLSVARFAAEVVVVFVIALGLTIYETARKLPVRLQIPLTVMYEPSPNARVIVGRSGRWRMRLVYIRSVLNEMGDGFRC